MTAKRNRHKQSVQPKVIEIATRKYLAIAIVITFLLSVILTVIQIVSLSGYTSHLADTGARQLEQRLELALQNIQSNASMLRVSRETAKRVKLSPSRRKHYAASTIWKPSTPSS